MAKRTIFYHYEDFRTRSVALRVAKMLRGKGYRARVQEVRGGFEVIANSPHLSSKWG